MKCSACARDLSTVRELGINLDVCSDGCGGIWFDAQELDLLDDNHVPLLSDILVSGKSQNDVVLDKAKLRKCPKCPNVTLKRDCNYLEFDIEIDSCPNCSGVWLDPGELQLLRSENEGRERREQVMTEFMKQCQDSSSKKNIKAVLGLLFT